MREEKENLFSRNETVYRNLLEKIRNEAYPPGSRLPGERALAEEHACSRVTVRRALERLARIHAIRRIQGDGTYVNPNYLHEGPDFRIALVLDPFRQYAPDNPYLAELMSGILTAKLPVSVFLKLVQGDPGDSVETCFEKSGLEITDCSGIIAAQDLSPEATDFFRKANVPFVALQKPASGESVSYVTIDNRQGAYLAASHLLQTECRNIYCVFPEENSSLEMVRTEGFARALREYGLSDSPGDFVLHASSDTCISAEKVIDSLIGSGKAFDGLFLGSDYCTFGAVTSLRKHGLRIPDDVSIVMWDDFSWVPNALSISVTSIRQPFRDQVADVLEILLDHRGKKDPSAIIQKTIQPSLIIRESTTKMRNERIKTQQYKSIQKGTVP